MALPSTNGNNKIDSDVVATAQTEIVEIEADVAQLSEAARTNPALLGGEDVALLLERLSNAEDMADGVETKLDTMLEKLDNLLAALDDARSQQQQQQQQQGSRATTASNGTQRDTESSQ